MSHCHRQTSFAAKLLVGWIALSGVNALYAQDLETRKWSHLPKDVNVAGALYGYTQADIFLDPVLELDSVELDLQTVAVKYMRTFELLSRSARLEIMVPYQEARWEGLLQGQPASRERQGLADPMGRFAVNLYGAPPLDREEFPSYRAAHPVRTTVGAALAVQVPVGEYDETRLLNLGDNRYVVRPELGVEHTCGKWLSELTGSVFMFTDNDEFWNGNQREQDPIYALQGHVNYTFKPGLWAGVGAAYGLGGESTINGVPKNDPKENLILGLSAGVPINAATGLKFAYLRSRTYEDTGSDSDSFLTALTMLW